MALIKAARSNNTATVTQLLDKGAKKDLPDKVISCDERTCLRGNETGKKVWETVKGGRKEIVKRVIISAVM